MRKPRHSYALAIALAACAACGGKKSNDTPDAGGDQPDATEGTPDAPGKMACDELMSPAATFDALPGTYTGTVVGGGADIDVAQGICTVEKDGQYYEPKGEDVVIKVTGLTVGQNYGVTLTADDDLSFYVISGCTNASGGPATGQCDLFDDQYLGGDNAMFTASATEEYIVVDNSEDPSPPTTGTFTLDVVAATCDVDADPTTCTAPTPFCLGYECVECQSDFDCTTAGKPVCDPTGTCVASTGGCTGDDAHDSGAGDDGPAAATTIAAPTIATPTVVNAAVCDTPASEGDWYKVTLPAGDLGIAVDFTGAANDLDVGLFDSTGTLVDAGTNLEGQPEAFTSTGLTAGVYYVEVIQYAPDNNTAAVPYTLTLDVPVCASSFDCNTAAKPACSGNGLCAAGPTQCVGDDAGDTTSGGDDGPAGARSLTATPVTPASLTGKVCATPGSEADYYKTTVVGGTGLTADLTWTGTDDLNLVVTDANGNAVGADFWRDPTQVKLTYLPAGTYYLVVTKAEATPTTTTTPYTLQISITTPQVCTSSTDCAAEYQTQLYRGGCTAGSCHFLATTNVATGGACDAAGTQCTDFCSYNPFQASAQKSKCSVGCDTTADCTAAGGLTGFQCATQAGTGYYCAPACATDLDCGTLDPTDGAIDTGQPWNYGTCTVATGVCAFD